MFCIMIKLYSYNSLTGLFVFVEPLSFSQKDFDYSQNVLISY